jgi:predicted acetyltransferase
MPELVSPSIDYQDSYLDALKEFQAEGRNTDLDYQKIRADFPAFVKSLRDQERGIGLPSGFVPQTVYWLVEGNEFLGKTSIRQKLNETLQLVGGHIGYEIRPSQRRQGYGTLLLKLALEKAKDIGLKKILVTCDVGNTASHKIIEKAGGVLDKEIKFKDDTPNRYRFWITNE